MSFAVDKLQEIQTKNKSMICLGLDLDVKRMPADAAKSIKTMYEYAMNIVDATKDIVCAYKPNMAFYETLGHDGLSLLESICKRIPEEIPIILDGKRGDIGNTASFYAEAMFTRMKADWVTLNPYMGYDALRPFLEHKDKGIFVLCLTSNTGSKDFQMLEIDGKPLYKVVAEKVDYWNKDDNCGLVVGATQPEQLKELRDLTGAMPLLIPGVGAQGGSLEKAVLYGTDEFKKIAVINVSRSVLYASTGPDYADKAREELIKLNKQVAAIRAGDRTTDEAPQQPEQVTESQEQVSDNQPHDNNKTAHLSASAVTVPSSEIPKEEPTQVEHTESEQQSESTPVESAPSEPTSVDSTSPESAPVESTPSEPTSVDSTPPESTPVESAPPEQTPIEPASQPEPHVDNSMPTPPPIEPIKPPPIPEPVQPSEPQSSPPQQTEPETPKPEQSHSEQPQQQPQSEPRKEPPPMPKPPPPLPPVPEIPRFDKPPERKDNNQSHQSDRQHNNDRNRHGGNNNRFKKRHERRNHSQQNNSNFNRRRDDTRDNNQNQGENRDQNQRRDVDKNN